LFDFDRDLYGAHLRVHFVQYLRPEMKFDGLDALKAQMKKDDAAARARLLKIAPVRELGGAYA
jgi:riboflavin kinase/FMN adenylyltransferase